MSPQSRTLWALAVAMAAATPLAPLTAQQPSIQQQFDAASAALEAEHWEEALRLFEAMEARARSPRNLAIIRTRKAGALVDLGRLGEAAQALRVALPDLPADDASLFSDRYLGLVTLGRIAESQFDYDEATRQFRAAAAIPLPAIERLTAYRGLIQTQLFSDAGAALREADLALQIVAGAATPNPAAEGLIRTLRGRALLNLHRFNDARIELDQAMRRLGNLTLRVDRADLIARSDLATAALLSGNGSAARRYLAYTGAGRFGGEGYINLRPNYELPACGADMAPDDVVVVQLLIGDDGRVGSVLPIYASRQGPSALFAARKVVRWQFDREALGTIEPLLRSVVRLEIRCSTDIGFPAESEDMIAVAQRLGAANPEWGRDLAALALRPVDLLRAELAALERDRAPARAQLLLLLALAYHPGIETAERVPLLRRAFTAAAEAGVTARPLAAIAAAVAFQQHDALNQRWDQSPDFEAVLALPQIQASPAALAAVRLAKARFLYTIRSDDEALALAANARATPGLDDTDPAHGEALGLEAAIRAARGDMAGARAAVEAIGPGPARCGPARRLTRTVASSRDFPMAAASWGFEGWATSESIVDAAGRAAAPRVVLAYPPFVFGEAEQQIARRARYDPVYRPDGLVCPPVRTRVRFALPHPARAGRPR